MADKVVEEPTTPEKESFLTFLYNRKDGSVLGRTAASWAKITLFYCIFYACLAGWFAGLLHAFYSTLDPVAPKYYGLDSLHQNNPSLGVRPMPLFGSTLIRFSQGIPSSYRPFTDHLQAFLNVYENNTDAVDCGEDGKSNDTAACRVDVATLLKDAGCGEDYGYKEGEPCVVIKLNKLFDFKPEPYANKADALDDLNPGDDDGEGKEEAPEYLSISENGDSIGISCAGDNEIDKSHIADIKLTPSSGISMKFFPYKNQKGYRSPFVVAQLKLKDVAKRSLVQIGCKIWAKNVARDEGTERVGAVHFELMID